MKLAELTWPEVAERLRQTPGLIVPVGTCEQHGPHLPLDTDTAVAEHVAEYLALETGYLMAPTLAYGVNLPCDRGFAGTTTLSRDALRQNLLDMTDWWQEQGFLQFFLVTAHGDPQHLEALSPPDRDNIHLLKVYDFPCADLLTRQETARHAGEVETSVMLHLFPERVRVACIEDFAIPPEQFRTYLSHQNTDPIPGSPGCQGYPSAASADKGALLVDRMRHHALDWIHSL